MYKQQYKLIVRKNILSKVITYSFSYYIQELQEEDLRALHIMQKWGKIWHYFITKYKEDFIVSKCEPEQ